MSEHLCLWCGKRFDLDTPPKNKKTYCSEAHEKIASQRRRNRKKWKDRECRYPDTPAYTHRGLALVNGPIIQTPCPCGKYHNLKDIEKASGK